MQHRRQPRRRVLLHRRQGVGIDRERDLDLLVTEPPLDDVRRNAGLQQQRRARMSQPMELDRADTGGLDQPGVLSLAEVIGLQGVAERVVPTLEIAPLLREHQAVVVVVLAVRQLQLGLVPAVASQDGDRLGRDLDRPGRLVLHRPEHRRRARFEELPLECHPASGEVDVSPPQPAQLALPGARVQGERVEGRRARARGLGGHEEGLGLVSPPSSAPWRPGGPRGRAACR